MSIEITRITIDALSCGDCDCGACLTTAVAALKAFDGVVYVGFDRRRMEFAVRHEESTTGTAALHETVQSCGLIVIPIPA
jgi:hypothetical protein